MSKTIYILAHFEIDEFNDFPWMNSKPFFENYSFEGPGKQLCLLSDIFWNKVAPEKAIINISLYKIKINTINDFLNQRQKLFDSKNFTPSFVANLGFEKIVDFAYEVNENNRNQFKNGHQLSFCYDKKRMIVDQYYLSCPTIILNE